MRQSVKAKNTKDPAIRASYHHLRPAYALGCRHDRNRPYTYRRQMLVAPGGRDNRRRWNRPSFFIGGHVAKKVTILTPCYFLFYPFKPQCPKSLFKIVIGLIGLNGCQLLS
tara:strand:- start:92 stop:424 length:333 start_codon:yes stop_codon:yes gene_type:complete